MPAQYSDSSAPFLAVDTASPRISVAVGREGRVLAGREAAAGPASPSLLRLIDDALAAAGVELRELAGVLAVRGPGSFTGLRVGLSTVLGLHRSLGVPSTAVPTFDVLAWQTRPVAGTSLAVVDALRGEWFSQLFDAGELPRPLEEPVLRTAEAIAHTAATAVTGFGLAALVEAGLELELREATALAPSLLEWSARATVDWNPLLLTQPLYLRPPAARG